ncbi:6945_t:CDS:2, partial [Entrophospora sp. SA101]
MNIIRLLDAKGMFFIIQSHENDFGSRKREISNSFKEITQGNDDGGSDPIFSHAFFLLLKPNQNFALDYPDFNDDTNNPWNLVNKYYTYFANNSLHNQDSFLVQQPDPNTNMFAQFSSSILAMYNFLAGDNGAFEAWVLQDDSYLTVLVVAFSFIVVVYLMNLFIGLLSNEIEHYNTKEAFLAQKAKIIIEIELFYLFPNQHHWRNWFPDILYYDAPIDDIHKKIKEIDDSNEDEEDLPYISDKLRELAETNLLKYLKKTENDFDSRFQQIEDKLVEVSKKTENDFDSRFQQIENILENNMKEIEKNLKDDLKEMENKLNNNNDQ